MAVLPHGDDAGRHPDPGPAGGPAYYNPIHEDDIIATLPKLLEVASIPATTVNWCGHQTVSLQEWCGYLGSLVGKEPVFQESEQALRGNPTDATRMHELVGETTVDWRDGLRRMRPSSTRSWSGRKEPLLPDADVVDEHLRRIGPRPGVAATEPATARFRTGYTV